MEQIGFSRRAFLGSAVAFGAFGFKDSEKPNLKLGVLSDVHIRVNKQGKALVGNERGCVTYLIRAFEHFRAQAVDAVVIAGDIADLGLTDELQAVADAWYKVFPNDCLPNGDRVEKVFIYGNHDWEGASYSPRLMKEMWPDEEERKRHFLHNDYAGNWKRIFHEEYEPIYRKTVKGYDFIGAHWDPRAGFCWGGSKRVEEYFNGLAKIPDPKKPFFFIQHSHPQNTCYGPWVWGHDSGQATRALSAFPNAIALSGHSHASLTDDRSVWQGAFTSIGTGSMSDIGAMGEEHAPVGRENACNDIDLVPSCWKYDGKKMMPNGGWAKSKHGAVYSVFDDRIEISRMDFLSGLQLGYDWVVPLTRGSATFAFDERAKQVGVPRFVKGGKVEIARVRAKNRGSKGKKPDERIVAVERDAIRVTAPAAVADPKARLFDLEFVAESRSGEKLVKYLAPDGFNLSYLDKRAEVKSFCVFATDELPKGGDVRFVVTPLNCYGARGRSIAGEWFKI